TVSEFINNVPKSIRNRFNKIDSEVKYRRKQLTLKTDQMMEDWLYNVKTDVKNKIIMLKDIQKDLEEKKEKKSKFKDVESLENLFKEDKRKGRKMKPKKFIKKNKYLYYTKQNKLKGFDYARGLQNNYQLSIIRNGLIIEYIFFPEI